MKIAFRVDASLQMGSGHVMRCLTLASALQRRGAECHFICRPHPGNLMQSIAAAGYPVHELAPADGAIDPPGSVTPAHISWLGVSQDEDARQSGEVLQALRPDWLIVDHYGLDAAWQRLLRPYCGRLMVIDDLADRPHVCDLLLDQTFGRDQADYQALVPENCTLLCGSSNALLRPEFAQHRPASLARRRASARAEQLLISMGGVDQANATAIVLDVLAGLAQASALHIKVVMGSQAPWLAAVRELAARLPLQVEVLVDQRDMAGLMAQADLAIGAAGSTAWERCCLGLPSIMVVLADNQRAVAAGLESVGAARIIASVDSITRELPGLLAPLLEQPELARQMSEAAAQVSDGCGVQAVLQALQV